MNVQEFTNLLQKPHNVISASQTQELEEVLTEYPYFQAARAIHLKGLKNLNSFKYNNALKVTAAYTTDRDILFEFITSKDFLQNSIADAISGKSPSVVETEIISEEIVSSSENKKILIEESDDQPLPQTRTDADAILDPKLFASKDPHIDQAIEAEKEQAAKSLEIGKPLSFTKDEKYSFSEWLQLASQKTISRNSLDEPKTEEGGSEFQLEQDVLKKKKFELIDKFIANNPRIVPVEKTETPIHVKESVKFDKKELMTETLAKVYLEQKKYKKAIQAYKILSLKYPEKSGFFADRINIYNILDFDYHRLFFIDVGHHGTESQRRRTFLFVWWRWKPSGWWC